MMIHSITLAHDPDTTMTPAEFWARSSRMRETWPQLTPVQQSRWRELKRDIEGMASDLHWLQGLFDEQPEPLPEMQQLRLKEGRR